MRESGESPSSRAAGFKSAESRLRFLFIGLTLACSWLAMQWVHEAGHLLGAIASGGEVEQVILHPLSISRTDLAANPHPLIVAWAGPVFGVLAPITIWLIAHAWRLNSTSLFRFFAGFCCIANGAYIGLGSFDAIGDCGELIRHGAPLWQLWLFGAGNVAGGLFLWHGLGPHFGLEPRVRRKHLAILALLLAGMAIAGLLLSHSA